MLSVGAQARIQLYTAPADMRKGIDGLSGLVRAELGADPADGSLFVFINRRRDRIKLLYWGGTGFCIWYQQLEKGSYQLPEVATADDREGLEITASQLSLILDGIDLSSIRQRARYQLPTDQRTASQAVGVLA